jgi:hypothetical protein
MQLIEASLRDLRPDAFTYFDLLFSELHWRPFVYGSWKAEDVARAAAASDGNSLMHRQFLKKYRFRSVDVLTAEEAQLFEFPQSSEQRDRHSKIVEGQRARTKALERDLNARRESLKEAFTSVVEATSPELAGIAGAYLSELISSVSAEIYDRYVSRWLQRGKPRFSDSQRLNFEKNLAKEILANRLSFQDLAAHVDIRLETLQGEVLQWRRDEDEKLSARETLSSQESDEDLRRLIFQDGNLALSIALEGERTPITRMYVTIKKIPLETKRIPVLP